MQDNPQPNLSVGVCSFVLRECKIHMHSIRVPSKTTVLRPLSFEEQHFKYIVHVDQIALYCRCKLTIAHLKLTLPLCHQK